MENVVEEILKVIVVQDNENDDYVQDMGVEGRHKETEARDAISIISIYDEDCKLVNIP